MKRREDGQAGGGGRKEGRRYVDENLWDEVESALPLFLFSPSLSLLFSFSSRPFPHEKRVQDMRAERGGISLAGRKVRCKLLARTLVIITRSPHLNFVREKCRSTLVPSSLRSLSFLPPSLTLFLFLPLVSEGTSLAFSLFLVRHYVIYVDVVFLPRARFHPPTPRHPIDLPDFITMLPTSSRRLTLCIRLHLRLPLRQQFRRNRSARFERNSLRRFSSSPNNRRVLRIAYVHRRERTELSCCAAR